MQLYLIYNDMNNKWFLLILWHFGSFRHGHGLCIYTYIYIGWLIVQMIEFPFGNYIPGDPYFGLTSQFNSLYTKNPFWQTLQSFMYRTKITTNG